MQIYPPGTEIGQYRVLSKPMMGGMGVVYACHDLTNDRAVALKTFKPEYLPDRAARDRFLREGTAWVELGKHPHIVRCHEVKYFDPTAFLVLELIVKDEGREDASLRSWLGQPLPLETALLFTLQIARGLQHATQKLPGFVHRDLKPENILVGSDKLPGTDVNRLRVTDFGLVAMLTGDERQRTEDEDASVDGPSASVLSRTHLTRGIMGTPLYMAPEQWTGEPVGVYTDVYALGCILYEMLTGQRTANGHSITELQAAHCEGRLHPIPAELPGDVADFLARCLALDTGRRYPDWQAVLSALETACAAQGLTLSRLEAGRASHAEQRDLASSYNEMGSSYLHMGNARAATGYYEKALGILRQIGDRRGEGAALGNLGNAYADLGDPRRAIEYHEQALTISREIGDRRSEGAVLGNLGNAYAALGDPRRAIEYHEQSLHISREIGDRQGEGADLGNLGNAYRNLSDPRRAIDFYQQQLSIVREIGDRRGEGNALGNLGLAYADLGNPRRAIEFYEEALKIDREIGDRRGEGNDLGNLGLAYADLGDPRRAIDFYQQQLSIVREIGDRQGEGAALGNLGSAYYRLGDPRRAIDFYQQAIVIRREIGDRRGEGNDLGNLGVAYADLGDPRRAIDFYQQALHISREIGDRRGEGNNLGNLGTAYHSLGDPRRAIGFFEEAIVIRREIGDINGVATDSFNMAHLYRRQGEVARAIPLAQEAERIWSQIGSPNAQKARQLLAQLQGGEPPSETVNPAQAAFEAFQRAGSVQDMQAAVAAHPVLRDPQFHQLIEQVIREQVPQDAKPAFQERLAWLKQLTQST